MNTLMKYAAGAVLAAASVASANAATYVFNLNGSDHSGTIGPLGNERFSTSGPVNVRATGWSTDASTVAAAYLGAYAKGYGVETELGDAHPVGSIGTNDFVLLQFDRKVVLESVVFEAFNNGLNQKDTDAGFAYGTTGMPWNADIFNDGDAVGSVASLFSGSFTSAGTAAGGLRAVNPGAESGSIWVIGGYNLDQVEDAFKISQITVSAVPEASTWAMMIFGFGAVGAAMRGRRKVAKVSYAF